MTIEGRKTDKVDGGYDGGNYIVNSVMLEIRRDYYMDESKIVINVERKIEGYMISFELITVMMVWLVSIFILPSLEDQKK